MSRLSSRIIDAFALCLPKTERSRARAVPRRFTSSWGVRVHRRRENGSQPVHVQSTSPPSCANLSSNIHFHAPLYLQPSLLHPFTLIRAFKGDCLVHLCSSSSLTRRPVRNSHPIYVAKPWGLLQKYSMCVLDLIINFHE